jgi:hypothetical protein
VKRVNMMMDKAANVSDAISHARDVPVLRILNVLYVLKLKTILEAVTRSFCPVNAHASLGTTILEKNFVVNVIIPVKFVMELMPIIVQNVMELVFLDRLTLVLRACVTVLSVFIRIILKLVHNVIILVNRVS